MEMLHQVALQGSMRDIAQRAAHLATLDERYRPFADQLLSMANRFQSKAILSFVEQHLAGDLVSRSTEAGRPFGRSKKEVQRKSPLEDTLRSS